MVDFGISGYCKNNSTEWTDAGTLKFMPPEIHNRTQVNADPAADIWALGVIFYMVLFDEYPFEGEGEELFQNIINCKWKLPEEWKFSAEVKVISESAEDLLKGMLKADPK